MWFNLISIYHSCTIFHTCVFTVHTIIIVTHMLFKLTSYPGLPPRLYLAADFSPRLRDKVWAGGLGTRLLQTTSLEMRKWILQEILNRLVCINRQWEVNIICNSTSHFISTKIFSPSKMDEVKLGNGNELMILKDDFEKKLNMTFCTPTVYSTI